VQIDPSKVRIGDVILCATGTQATIATQKKLGYGDSSRWTHVAGSIGGEDLVEGQTPRARVCSLQKDYLDKGIEIRVMRFKNWTTDADRIKTALWWATMNGTPYDPLQLVWFPVAAWVANGLLKVKNCLSSRKWLICSEFIDAGFKKTGYNLFNRPSENIVPADFDNTVLFDVIDDIWTSS
jgi:hypothetical protein